MSEPNGEGQCKGYAGDPGASAPRCESYAGHPGSHFIRSPRLDATRAGEGLDALPLNDKNGPWCGCGQPLGHAVPNVNCDAARAGEGLREALRGDGPCQDCGTLDNIVWFTENVLWNRVMGGSGTLDDPGGIVCIPCFVNRADAAGLQPTGWRLLAEWPWRDRAALHPATAAEKEIENE